MIVEVTLIETGLIIAHPNTEQETHYQIVGVLGEGGSGTTYQACIVGSETSVALKQLSLKQMDDWKSIDLFEREAKTLSQLNHPAIPKYIDYFTIDTPTDRHFYIAQALAPGKTLSDWSESGARYTEAEITQSNLKLNFRDKIQVSPAFADWLERTLEPDPIVGVACRRQSI
jgi:hypothetical protein